MRFKSIKTQLLFWFGAITVIILLGFNSLMYHFLQENTKLNIQNKFYNKAVHINRQIIQSVPMGKLLEDPELKNVDAAIFKEDKIVFLKGETDFKQFTQYIDNKESFFVFSDGEGLDGLYVLKINNPFKGAILFYENNIGEEIKKTSDDMIKILLILEPLLLLVLIFAASKLLDKILKSIKRITETANKIYVTNLNREIPQPKYDDEIKDLVDSFNGMITRLRNGVQLLEQFNSDVSHELKTPLTVIKGEIEITLNKDRDQEYYERSLKTIDSEAQNIQMIVDDLLLLTKFTKENVETTFETVQLDSLLLDVMDRFKTQLKNKNIQIKLEKIQTVSLKANAVLIKTIFSNLIDNAIKYSTEDTTITLSLYKDEKIHFVCSDQGVGIPEEQLEKITDRFYRVDSSRNKKIKGFGLGLSIVKNSVELHNGQIILDSKENVGTTIEVVL